MLNTIQCYSYNVYTQYIFISCVYSLQQSQEVEEEILLSILQLKLHALSERPNTLSKRVPYRSPIDPID